MVPSLHPEHASNVKPGPVVLFGSGETPAGFELNSPQVAGRVAEFLEHHLQNYDPQVKVIPARKRGTAFSPDSSRVTYAAFAGNKQFVVIDRQEDKPYDGILQGTLVLVAPHLTVVTRTSVKYRKFTRPFPPPAAPLPPGRRRCWGCSGRTAAGLGR